MTIIWNLRKNTRRIWNGIRSRSQTVRTVSLLPDFFYGKPDENTQIYDNNTYVKEYTYLGYAEEVDEKGLVHITQRNKFSVGETIEIMKPDGRNLTVTVQGIYDETGASVESAPHPQQKLAVDLGAEVEKYDLLRRAEA